MLRGLPVFVGERLKVPGGVAAVAPSSAAMAGRMTPGPETAEGPVVEPGPGTGNITRAVLVRGVAPERLTPMETGARFGEELERRFPGVRVLNRPAQDIARIGLQGAGAVICAVPVLARSNVQREVVGAALRVMRPGGFLDQVNDSPRPPLPPAMRAEPGLEVEHPGVVRANMPPAQGFRCRPVRRHGRGGRLPVPTRPRLRSGRYARGCRLPFRPARPMAGARCPQERPR